MKWKGQIEGASQIPPGACLGVGMQVKEMKGSGEDCSVALARERSIRYRISMAKLCKACAAPSLSVKQQAEPSLVLRYGAKNPGHTGLTWQKIKDK